MLWRVLLPTTALLAFSAWALWDRNLGAFQVVASAPFLYVLVYSTVGAFAYRSGPTGRDDVVRDEDLPSVTVLIPAHNEENVIANTLSHVLRIRHPRLDVIVIDDASTDRTGEIVQGFPVRLVTRRDPMHRGKSEALNAGLELARGDIVCVFDADSEMAPDFLRLAVAPLVAHPDVCGVQGQVRMYNRRHNTLTRAQDDEFAVHNEVLQLGRDRLRGACALGGNGQLTRRSALETVGGWNPSSLTEDLDLTVRLLLAGCGRVAHCTAAVVWQEGVPTIKALLRQRTRWAEGILRCFRDYVGAVLVSRRMSVRERVDTFWALFSVFLPILSVAGLVFSALNVMPGFFQSRLPDVAAGVLMVVALVAIGIASVTVSFKRDRRFTLMPVVRYVVYMLHWVPAFACAFRNVVRDRPLVWQKTEHASPRPATPRPARARSVVRAPDLARGLPHRTAVSDPIAGRS